MSSLSITVGIRPVTLPSSGSCKLSRHSSHHESGDDPYHESSNNQNYGKKTANLPGDTEKMEETLLLQPAIISTNPPGLELMDLGSAIQKMKNEITKALEAGRTEAKEAYGTHDE